MKKTERALFFVRAGETSFNEDGHMVVCTSTRNTRTCDARYTIVKESEFGSIAGLSRKECEEKAKEYMSKITSINGWQCAKDWALLPDGIDCIAVMTKGVSGRLAPKY